MKRAAPRALVLAAAALALTTAAPPALAQRSPAKCDSDRLTNVELGGCLDRALQAADAKLNTVYKAAVRMIDADDSKTPKQRAEWKGALQKAQRAWVAFRDLDCGEPVGYEWFGGSGMGPATLQCTLDKTERRIEELTGRYGER